MARFTVTFCHKERVAEQTYIVVFQTSSDATFIPGQFATIEVAPKQRRSYSYVDICQTSPQYLSEELADLTGTDSFYHVFLISTKSGGLASQLFESVDTAVELDCMAPLGRFQLDSGSPRAKNFICTGTGLAPFVPMVKQARSENPDAMIRVFFGISADIGDYGRRFFAEYEGDSRFAMYTGMFPIQVDTQTEYVRNGTVTQIVPAIISDMAAEEYYLCGNPYMVADVKKLLAEVGADAIFSENFGPLPAAKK